MRRRYEDDGISDDEIEGKRTFDLEEKLSTNKFNSTFVVFMEGKGLWWGCCAAVVSNQTAAFPARHGVCNDLSPSLSWKTNSDHSWICATPKASLAANLKGGYKAILVLMIS